MDFITLTSDGVGNLATNVSLTLPSNFREVEGEPQVYLGSGQYLSFEQIFPNNRFSKQPDDRYMYVLGNPAAGFTAVFNQLTSLATLTVPYQRFPSGFATLTDQCELDDDTFIVEQVKSYVLQARSDDRFPIVEANANRLLLNMNGRQSRQPLGGENRTPQVTRFRIGE